MVKAHDSITQVGANIQTTLDDGVISTDSGVLTVDPVDGYLACTKKVRALRYEQAPRDVHMILSPASGHIIEGNLIDADGYSNSIRFDLDNFDIVVTYIVPVQIPNGALLKTISAKTHAEAGSLISASINFVKKPFSSAVTDNGTSVTFEVFGIPQGTDYTSVLTVNETYDDSSCYYLVYYIVTSFGFQGYAQIGQIDVFYQIEDLYGYQR